MELNSKDIVRFVRYVEQNHSIFLSIENPTTKLLESFIVQVCRGRQDEPTPLIQFGSDTNKKVKKLTKNSAPNKSKPSETKSKDKPKVKKPSHSSVVNLRER